MKAFWKWLDKLETLQARFVLWFVLGLVVIVIFLIIPRITSCPLEPTKLTEERFFHSISIEGNQQRQKDENKARFISRDNDQSADNAQENTEKKDIHERLLLLVCDARLTDIALALLTYCLVIVGYFQILRNEKTVRDLERAFLFFSLGPFIVPGSGKYTVFAKNTGRTPAIVKEYFFGFRGDVPTDEQPTYSHTGIFEFRTYEGIVPANDSPQIGTLTADVDITPIAYGYFRYEDIFKRPHTSRFCWKIGKAGVPLEVVGSPQWNEWD